MPDNKTTRDVRLQHGPDSLSTRRSFIAAASLGAVSLYGLWAAYGAAPFRLFGGDDHGDSHGPVPEPAEHGGHSAAARGPTVDEFRHSTEAFIARHRQADGSVDVGAASGEAQAASHGAHGAGHEMPPVVTAAPAGPTDVYLLVQQWSFEPDVLRLRAGVPYRFRMMAVDVAHGASPFGIVRFCALTFWRAVSRRLPNSSGFQI